MNNLPAPDDDEPIDKIEDSSDQIADTSGSSGAFTYTYDPSGRQVHLTADLGTQSVSSQENPDIEIESKRSKASYSYASNNASKFKTYRYDANGRSKIETGDPE